MLLSLHASSAVREQRAYGSAFHTPPSASGLDLVRDPVSKSKGEIKRGGGLRWRSCTDKHVGAHTREYARDAHTNTFIGSILGAKSRREALFSLMKS